ncbi:MAG TPA: GTP cyclohydrolase II [Phaeodactylibacter sp.]|nr:GTP cyclohydrolase II [Phaeodactylibacter sp.]
MPAETRFFATYPEKMKKQAEALIPTPHGDFRMVAFAERQDEPMPHIALVHKDFEPEKPTLVRIHSECMTGDLFGSKRCDCGEQLEKALELTAQKGGIVLYLRQEGRGIGLINKLKAYKLQDQGLNTIDANIHLGFEPDERHYDVALSILEQLGVKEIHLLTNNPEKIAALDHSPIKVLSRVPLIVEPGNRNREYLKVKQKLMGHML